MAGPNQWFVGRVGDSHFAFFFWGGGGFNRGFGLPNGGFGGVAAVLGSPAVESRTLFNLRLLSFGGAPPESFASVPIIQSSDLQFALSERVLDIM